jgi:hypothetical protein
MAAAAQKGELKARPGSPVAEMAKMAPTDLRKFATTPEGGLPEQAPAPPAAPAAPAPPMRMKQTPTGALTKKRF